MNSHDLSILTQCAIAAAYQAGRLIARSDISQIAVKKKTGGESLAWLSHQPSTTSSNTGTGKALPGSANVQGVNSAASAKLHQSLTNTQSSSSQDDIGQITGLASQVVTEIDIASQAIIIKALEPTLKRFDLGLLSEEQADNLERLHKDFFWCIDPLDGTLAYTQSKHGYSVSIALVSKKGEPLIGVIYDPMKDTLYHAIKNQGAFINNNPWQSSSKNAYVTFINDQSFASSAPDVSRAQYLNNIAHELGYDEYKVITQGGAAMNAMWVVEHSPACYFKLPKVQSGGGSLWDFAASACIFTELGAQVSDIYGNLLQLNPPATTFMNEKGILYSSCLGHVSWATLNR